MTASTSDMTFRNAFAVFCREVTGPHAGKIVFCFWTDEKGREFWEGPSYTVIPRDELIDASNLRDAG